MIRINLLPVRRTAIRQYGKQQLLLGLLLIGVEIAVLFTLYSGKSGELADEREAADQIQVEVDELSQQNEVIGRLNSQKEQLENLARILEDLEANRAGPVQVLDELKEMLNAPANDLQRVAQQRRNWDTSWDPRSVWITSFDEDTGSVDIMGRAMTNDDVAEFTVRLASSHYFTGVRLNRTAAANAEGIGPVFEFEITANVNYGLLDEDES